MHKVKPPVSMRPMTLEDKKSLDEMDYESYVPSEASPSLRWFDLIPLHYIFLQVAGLKVAAALLQKDQEFLSFVYLILTFGLFIYSLVRSWKLSELIFEKRIVLPNKTSFTTVVVDRTFLPSYRFWVRLSLALVETYGLLFFALANY